MLQSTEGCRAGAAGVVAVVGRPAVVGRRRSPDAWGGARWVLAAVRVGGWLKCGSPGTWVPGLPFNVCPAVSYSPTLSRVQYHRRCGP